VLHRGGSPALSKLLDSRVQKGSVTPELESWALSVSNPESPPRSPEVRGRSRADIRAKARPEVVDTCVDIVSGSWPASGCAFEDWVLFNSFFRNSSGSSRGGSSSIYGSGFYVDISDANPVTGSPAFFLTPAGLARPVRPSRQLPG